MGMRTFARAHWAQLKDFYGNDAYANNGDNGDIGGELAAKIKKSMKTKAQPPHRRSHRA